jgi:hypothetical protein
MFDFTDIDLKPASAPRSKRRRCTAARAGGGQCRAYATHSDRSPFPLCSSHKRKVRRVAAQMTDELRRAQHRGNAPRCRCARYRFPHRWTDKCEEKEMGRKKFDAEARRKEAIARIERERREAAETIARRAAQPPPASASTERIARQAAEALLRPQSPPASAGEEQTAASIPREAAVASSSSATAASESGESFLEELLTS